MKSEKEMVKFFTKVMDRKGKSCVDGLCHCETAFRWERQPRYEYDLLTVKYDKSDLQPWTLVKPFDLALTMTKCSAVGDKRWLTLSRPGNIKTKVGLY